MMHRSELERRLAQDAGQITASAPSRVRRAVHDELSRARARARFRWALPAAAAAVTGMLAIALLQPERAPAPTPAPPQAAAPTVSGSVLDLAATPRLDQALAVHEGVLAEEYVRVQRDIARLRALIDPA